MQRPPGSLQVGEALKDGPAPTQVPSAAAGVIDANEVRMEEQGPYLELDRATRQAHQDPGDSFWIPPLL